MSSWEILDGETPIDISHLKVKGVGNRRQLNELEAANILSAARSPGISRVARPDVWRRLPSGG